MTTGLEGIAGEYSWIHTHGCVGLDDQGIFAAILASSIN
ncbi:hypothetical protein T11_3097 [Trichinella zimbabwensis]|uniref:Uncharacterized protein n=1 Tax=Trichinella zimbabwensis TaxID=268475 RepID=A0A0V1GGD0_9BILA|nr:hypothetical protein T11_3097 [Trichinella zimbabwensis]